MLWNGVGHVCTLLHFLTSPFGWPDAMVEAIHGYAQGQPWPADAVPPTLRYRTTDQFVHNVIVENATRPYGRCPSPLIASPSAPDAARTCSATTPPRPSGRSIASAS
jgi:hypothetical protein